MVEEDGTRSIGEIAQKLVISSRSVHRVLKDYPVRRNFCVWLLNKAAEYENFISRVLFSDESSFGRQSYLSACISASIFRKFVGRTSGRFSSKS
jgi:uncharacterized protein YpiB (UPF0302 family)